MKLRKSPSVLVVILCETRAWEITSDEFFRNLIDPLNADLALCVGDSERESDNPFYQAAKYTWKFPEPIDWGDAYEAAAGNRDWEALLSVHEQFFGGVKHETLENLGSGAIIMFFRYFLGIKLLEADLIGKYDWFIITRSDFRWPTIHPPLECFNDNRIYVLDGEQWGGVSDRYIAVPRKWIESYIAIVEPLFTDPIDLADRLRSQVQAEIVDNKYLNPEKFLAFRMRELDIWDKLSWLPYIPFAVRELGGSTRWSQGEYNDELGYFIKYSGEFQRSKIVTKYINTQADWKKYFRRFRGSSIRLRMSDENNKILSGR